MNEVLRDGRLGGHDPSELAERFGTPFYVYDLDVVTRQVEALRAVLPPSFDLAYAVKANPNLAILAHLRGPRPGRGRGVGRASCGTSCAPASRRIRSCSRGPASGTRSWPRPSRRACASSRWSRPASCAVWRSSPRASAAASRSCCARPCPRPRASSGCASSATTGPASSGWTARTCEPGRGRGGRPRPGWSRSGCTRSGRRTCWTPARSRRTSRRRWTRRATLAADGGLPAAAGRRRRRPRHPLRGARGGPGCPRPRRAAACPGRTHCGRPRHARHPHPPGARPVPRGRVRRLRRARGRPQVRRRPARRHPRRRHPPRAATGAGRPGTPCPRPHRRRVDGLRRCQRPALPGDHRGPALLRPGRLRPGRPSWRSRSPATSSRSWTSGPTAPRSRCRSSCPTRSRRRSRSAAVDAWVARPRVDPDTWLGWQVGEPPVG